MVERKVCPKCGSIMVRTYIQKYEGSRTVGWQPIGWYCKYCGTSISDKEWQILERRGVIKNDKKNSR